MKTTLQTCALALGAIFLTACGETSSYPALDTKEGIQQALDSISTELPKSEVKTIIEVAFGESEALENKLGTYSIIGMDANGSKMIDIDHRYVPTSEEWSASSSEDTDIDERDLAYKGIPTSELNADKILAYINQAKSMIPAEYEFQSIGKYSIKEEVEVAGVKEYKATGRYQHKFELNVIEKGKSTQIKGRRIETTYYGVVFATNKDGVVEMLEE